MDLYFLDHKRFSDFAKEAISFYISYSENIMNKYLFGFQFICYTPFYENKQKHKQLCKMAQQELSTYKNHTSLYFIS
jgi:hypothetical protein